MASAWFESVAEAQRRAEAIRDALAKDGVSPSRVDIAAAGEVPPLVPVAGGGREAANMRAQITF